MAHVSIQVVDGVDKGRAFLNVETPVTIGREEGNTVRLNDDRISRFHAKIQEDQGYVVLTDLDSTNGTRVNGENVQLRLLRTGDRIDLGRSTLVFGSPEEISDQLRNESSGTRLSEGQITERAEPHEGEVDFHPEGEHGVDVFERVPPDLPLKLTPAQAAQLSEVLDFLHRALADSIAPVHVPYKAKEARLPLAQWHRVQAVLGFLSHYARKVAEPPGKADVEAT